MKCIVVYQEEEGWKENKKRMLRKKGRFCEIRTWWSEWPEKWKENNIGYSIYTYAFASGLRTTYQLFLNPETTSLKNSQKKEKLKLSNFQ